MGRGRWPWYVVGGGFVIAWVALDLITGLIHPSPGVSPWYPGAGLTVTLLYRFGVKYAPAVIVAEAVRWAIRHTSVSLLAVCLVGLVIVATYAGAIFLLREVCGVVLPSTRTRDVYWFCGFALVSSACAAAAAVGVLVGFGEFPASSFFPVAQTFWLGDAIGILAVAPIADLALSVARGQVPSTYRRRVPPATELAFIVAVAVLGFVAFGVLMLDPARLAAFVLTFVPVAFLATQGGMRGAVLGIATLDVTLVATDAAMRPAPSTVVAGQVDAIVATILAFTLGSLAASRRRYKEYSRWLLFHDLRTALPNRVAFDEWLDRSAPGALWLACLDLDHFSFIDAAMERTAADALLRAAADRIAAIVPSPEFFGRFDSEAFVIARSGTRDDAVTYAHRLIEAFRSPLVAEPAALRFPVSIGVASGLGRERRALLTEAIAAMREAKAAGGNHANVFEPPPGLARGARLASELVRARDNGEFRLHYQPIARLADGRIAGFEALLRWDQPELGLLCPGAFLPALERSAMLDEIESWVVHEATAALARVSARDDLRVWINLTGRAAFDAAFVDALPRIARGVGLAPNRIVIEVTEAAVAGSDRMAQVTKHLALLGIGVAIDDFGTGHSTLERVRASHVDFVKLDRSFVTAVEDGEQPRGVAMAMLDVTRRIGADAVAEGLETQAQTDIFRAAGCKLGQGYAIGEPLDEASLRALLARTAGPT